MRIWTAQGLDSRNLVHSASQLVRVQHEIHSRANTFGAQQSRLSSMNFRLKQSGKAFQFLCLVLSSTVG